MTASLNSQDRWVSARPPEYRSRSASRYRRWAVLSALLALAVFFFGGCESSVAEADAEGGAATEASAADGVPETSSTATAVADDADPDSDADETEEGAAGGNEVAGSPLFRGVGEFGIAFDALNTQLHDAHGLERVDITQTSVQLPEGDGPGAFVAESLADGMIGGWAEADGTLSSLAVVARPEASARRSAVLTLMAITLEASDENIDAVNAALAEVEAGSPGATRYLLLDDRGVLFEHAEIDAEPYLSVVLAGPTTESVAVEAAARLRSAMVERLAA